MDRAGARECHGHCLRSYFATNHGARNRATFDMFCRGRWWASTADRAQNCLSVPIAMLSTSSRADGCSGTWPVVPATARPPHGAPGEERARDACKRWTPGVALPERREMVDERLSAADRALREANYRTLCAHPLRRTPRSAATHQPALPGPTYSVAVVPR